MGALCLHGHLQDPVSSLVRCHLCLGQADVLCVSSCAAKTDMCSLVRGWKKAAGDSDLPGSSQDTRGVFVLDTVQSLVTESGLDHFSLILTCLGCSLMGKDFKDGVV